MTYALLVLMLLATLIMQMLIGGARLVYSLPAYFVLGLAGLAAILPLRRREIVLPRHGCVPLAIILALYVAVRALFSPVDYLARGDFFMVLGALVIYLLTALVLTRGSRRMAFAWGLLVLGVVQAGLGVVQFGEGNNFMLLPWIYRPDIPGRASGLYIYPNHLAGLLEMMALLALSILSWARGTFWLRICAVACAVASLLGAAITASRGGFVSVTVGCFVLTSLSIWALRRLRHSHRTRWLLVAVLGLTIALSGAFWLTLKSDALARRVGKIYDPDNMRLTLWSAALHQFRLDPFFGTGGGTYLIFGRQFRAPAVQNDPLHVHNDYLELLAEYGLVGAGLFGAFLVAHLYSGWRGAARVIRVKLRPSGGMQSADLALTFGALAAVAALLVHSIVDFNLHLPANTLVLAFFFGLLANPAAVTSRSQPERRIPAPWLQFTTATCGGLLALLAILLLPSEIEGEWARTALRDGDYAAAVTDAENAVHLEHRNPDLYYYAGEARHYLSLEARTPAEARDLQERAIRDFKSGLVLFPQDVRLLLKLARTEDNLSLFAEAEETLERAFQADPKSGTVCAYYALHWHRQGQFDLAEQYYFAAQSLGENTISPAGLADLAREQTQRQRNVVSVLAAFVTPSPGENTSELDDSVITAHPIPSPQPSAP